MGEADEESDDTEQGGGDETSESDGQLGVVTITISTALLQSASPPIHKPSF